MIDLGSFVKNSLLNGMLLLAGEIANEIESYDKPLVSAELVPTSDGVIIKCTGKESVICLIRGVEYYKEWDKPLAPEEIEKLRVRLNEIKDFYLRGDYSKNYLASQIKRKLGEINV